jgi:hypothetical protein
VILLRSEGAAAADVVVVEFTLVIAVRCAVLRRSGVVGSGFGGRCLCVRCVGPQHEKWEPERRITPSSDNRSRLCTVSISVGVFSLAWDIPRPAGYLGKGKYLPVDMETVVNPRAKIANQVPTCNSRFTHDCSRKSGSLLTREQIEKRDDFSMCTCTQEGIQTHRLLRLRGAQCMRTLHTFIYIFSCQSKPPAAQQQVVLS